ncbi:hypothetical protein VPH35_012204 [Triticum aestivum]
MKRGREDAADEPQATIGGEHSAAVAAAVVAAAESAVVATAGGATTAVPPLAAIPADEQPDGEPVHEKVGEDLEEEKARLKRELYDRIEEEFYGREGVDEIEFKMAVYPRKGSDFNEDAIDEQSEEDEDNVGYDMDSRHSKSRYIMRQLIARKIKYRFYGKLGCPFCGKAIKGGINGLMQHAVTIGNSYKRDQKASTLAKHAAYGRFLQIVKVNEPYYIPPRRR